MPQPVEELSPLPPSTPEVAILGVILMELEKEHPGFAERCRRRAESEAHLAAVVKLRGPRASKVARENGELAWGWFGAVSLIVERLPPVKRPWWRV